MVVQSLPRARNGAHGAIAALLFGLGLALAGCAGRPHGMLVPIGQPVTGTNHIDLLVATTRMPNIAEAGEIFNGERGPALAFADIGISVPPDSAREIGEVQWPTSPPGDPTKEFVTLHVDRLDLAQADALFHARLAKTPKHRVLIFIHGYNTTFEEAVYRFAQIVNDSKSPVVPVLFTWPSRGSLLAYTYDRESANYSRDSLERILQRFASDPRVGEISILAHSMGNWVTLEALRQMAIRNKGISPKIANVMLAAPDVDVDVFGTQIEAIDRPRPKFTLFASQDDRALAVSKRIWGSTARLGAINPEMEPYRTFFEQQQITVIDLTKLKSGDNTNHSKFAESPEVVQIIGQRLVEGQSLSDTKLGFGERLGYAAAGAGSAIGTAAAITVTAPLAIVDGRTRETLGERFDQVRDGVEQVLPGDSAQSSEIHSTIKVPPKLQ
jgi:esterase/lipase superfamily enzyme